MPLYTYKCDKCDFLLEEIRKVDDRKVGVPCPNCEGTMGFCLPHVEAPSCLETVDKYRNVKNVYKLDEKLRERSKKHFLENERDELIEKHGYEHARKSGWVTKDGKKVRPIDLK